MSSKYFYLVLSFLFSFLTCFSETRSDFIIVDQFGYLPEAPKIAVIKNPEVGYDSWQSFTPGSTYTVVNVETGTQVFSGSLEAWNNGATDNSSGDQVWWFDFTEVTATGEYYILDVDKELVSYTFRISPSVYNEVLKQAVRTFYYQRAGHAKEEPWAETGWTDGASHLGAGQDLAARLFSAPNDASTERDVSGGWYDAGDYNKYTNWTADYVIEMMLAYLENPDVWTDDYNIPESGNGIPDLLDEAKWGMDHLMRLQLENGSVLSIVGLSHSSPPSAATDPSRYGPANTSATLTTAAAFAIGSKVYQQIGLTDYATELKNRAISAWDWAQANPDVLFQNNDDAYGSKGLGSGKQEVNDYGRLTKKLRAAVYLFDITGESEYQTFFDDNYRSLNLFGWSNFIYPFESKHQDMMLYYTTIPNATSSVVDDIRFAYNDGMVNGDDNFRAWEQQKDPFRAHIKDYTWGSNSNKCRKGLMFYNMIQFDINSAYDQKAHDAAMAYINYIHGVNPLNFVYLSNMHKYGAKNGVREFYHTWFANGSALWDRVGVSVYGPAPGFLTGGPNPQYNWDGCCPSNCGSPSNNALCVSETIIPPREQPNQKSYKDFNNNWPLNSWSVTENSNAYQLAYIRLLSRFVNPEYDCNGDLEGTATLDVCGTCSGGNTGLIPETDPDKCPTPFLNTSKIHQSPFNIFPNPAKDIINIHNPGVGLYHYFLYDIRGHLIVDEVVSGNTTIGVDNLSGGTYMVVIVSNDGVYTHKLIKQKD